MNQILIDQFQLPKEAKEVFLNRVKINRDFIKTMPGFISDEVYLCEKNGNILLVTITKWLDHSSLENAKLLIISEYQKQGFHLSDFLNQNSIQLERGIYEKI